MQLGMDVGKRFNVESVEILYKDPGSEVKLCTYSGEMKWKTRGIDGPMIKVMDGKGILDMSGGKKYEGYFKDNKKEGHGVQHEGNDDKYEGAFRAGYRHGYGKETSTDGNVYEGNWEGGKRSGHGKVTYADPKNPGSYEGEWRKDVKQGLGKETFPKKWGGFYYEGKFKGDEFTGQGEMRKLHSNVLIAAGTWLHSQRHGKVDNYFLKNGNIYSGDWFENKMHGNGTLFLCDKTCFHGIFDSGYPVEGIKLNLQGTGPPAAAKVNCLLVFQGHGMRYHVRGHGFVSRVKHEAPTTEMKAREWDDVYREVDGLTGFTREAVADETVGQFLNYADSGEQNRDDTFVGNHRMNEVIFQGRFTNWVIPAGLCMMTLGDRALQLPLGDENDRGVLEVIESAMRGQGLTTPQLQRDDGAPDKAEGALKGSSVHCEERMDEGGDDLEDHVDVSNLSDHHEGGISDGRQGSDASSGRWPREGDEKEGQIGQGAGPSGSDSEAFEGRDSEAFEGRADSEAFEGRKNEAFKGRDVLVNSQWPSVQKVEFKVVENWDAQEDVRGYGEEEDVTSIGGSVSCEDSGEVNADHPDMAGVLFARSDTSKTGSSSGGEKGQISHGKSKKRSNSGALSKVCEKSSTASKKAKKHCADQVASAGTSRGQCSKEDTASAAEAERSIPSWTASCGLEVERVEKWTTSEVIKWVAELGKSENFEAEASHLQTAIITNKMNGSDLMAIKTRSDLGEVLEYANVKVKDIGWQFANRFIRGVADLEKESVERESLLRARGPGRGFQPGDRVFAKYAQSGKFFKATIARRLDDCGSRYEIDWDDGDKTEKIKNLDQIKVGLRDVHPLLLRSDISEGWHKEAMPVRLYANGLRNHDDVEKRLEGFQYITETRYIEPMQYWVGGKDQHKCDCKAHGTRGCCTPGGMPCCCITKRIHLSKGQAMQPIFTADGRLTDWAMHLPEFVLSECGSACACGVHRCYQSIIRDSGLGPGKTVLRRVFVMAISREAGCGLFLGPDPVTKGSPLMEYVGEIKPGLDNSPYSFDINPDRESNANKKSSDGKAKPMQVIDALHKGNAARFMMHSCTPNLTAVYVQTERRLTEKGGKDAPCIPRIVFFALKDISPGEQLCFSYSEGEPSFNDMNGKSCWCVSCLNIHGRGDISDKIKRSAVDIALAWGQEDRDGT